MAAADSGKRARAHRPSDAHASAAQAELADRTYRRLLASGTAVTLAQYLDAVVGRGTAPEQARDRLEHDRARGRLVTVTHDGVTLVPTFQLTDDLEHRARVGELVRTLSDAGNGPWGIWDWAETSNSWLGARTPRPSSGPATGNASPLRWPPPWTARMPDKRASAPSEGRWPVTPVRAVGTA